MHVRCHYLLMFCVHRYKNFTMNTRTQQLTNDTDTHDTKLPHNILYHCFYTFYYNYSLLKNQGSYYTSMYSMYIGYS